MFGLSLIHAGFLAAGAAVAVPILIHLLMRPRARLVSIGTLRFLKLAIKETTRRRKIRRWLLLAMRAAAVLLLALLFARPYLASSGGVGRRHAKSSCWSISRAAWRRSIPAETLFACAQAAAEKILADLPRARRPTSRISTIVWAETPTVPDSAGTVALAPRQPGYAGTDFGQALCWARDVFSTSGRQHQKVYLLTDLQRTGQHALARDFRADVEVEVVEMGKPLMGNLAVEKVEVPQPTIRGQEPIVVTRPRVECRRAARPQHPGAAVVGRAAGPAGRSIEDDLDRNRLVAADRFFRADRPAGRLPRLCGGCCGRRIFGRQPPLSGL